MARGAVESQSGQFVNVRTRYRESAKGNSLNDLVFPNSDYDSLVQLLLDEDLESCAVLLTSAAPKTDGERRLLVSEIHVAPPDAYSHRTEHSAELKPSYIAPLVKKARLNEKGIAFVHTHPLNHSTPDFSWIDDEGERLLVDFLNRRIKNILHCALVITHGGCRARVMESGELIRVIQVGSNVRVVSDSPSSPARAELFDRQVRLFGKAGQEKLCALLVAIVGLGGTGSVVAQQLAHLGVSRFLLVDPDQVEITNLNRLVGARSEDLGRNKVAVVSRHINGISPSSSVQELVADVLQASVQEELKAADFVFSCTDTHGSRALLQQLAYQYYIPCIDVGVSITSRDGRVERISGRTQMLSPGLACLACGNLLDSDAVRRDFMSESERSADPYFIGEGEPQPAVVSLNSTVSSLAVTMFLGAVTGIPAAARYQNYDGIAGSVRPVHVPIDPNCVVCSPRGALGRGGEWALPSRRG